MLDAQWLEQTRQHFIFLVDINAMDANAKVLAAAAAGEKRQRRAVEKWAVAFAIVASSSIRRGVLTAVQWIAKTPRPVVAFATEEEARRYLRREWEKHTASAVIET